MNCILIPVFNRKPITLQCLELLGWTRDQSDWRVIIIDDASTDGTADAIRQQHPQVELVIGNGDLYWTGGMVAGMRRSLELGADVMIWLNDDTKPDEKSLRRLASIVREHPDWMVSSTSLVDGVEFNCHSLQAKAAPKTGAEFDPADMLAGYQVAFSRQLVETIGYPDESRWPQTAGDSSYSYTANLKGFKVLIDTRSFIDLAGYEPYPTVAEDFWRGDKPLSRRIHATFTAKKSRYRLATQWHLDCLHHGIPRTLVIFPARLAMWVFQIIRHKL